MTPKEKAQELFDKMLFCYQGHIDKYTAKECALIAVDEIIEQLSDDWGDNQWRANDYIGYWQQVKKETYESKL